MFDIVTGRLGVVLIFLLFYVLLRNCNKKIVEIIWYNLYKGIDSLFKCYIEREESSYVKKCNIL